MHACGKSGDAVEESKAGQMKASARRLVSSILCQPASRCLQLTGLALFYDPTTLTPLLLSTAYKPPQSMPSADLPCSLRPNYSYHTCAVHCLPAPYPSANLPCYLLQTDYSYRTCAGYCLPAAPSQYLQLTCIAPFYGPITPTTLGCPLPTSHPADAFS